MNWGLKTFSPKIENNIRKFKDIKENTSSLGIKNNNSMMGSPNIKNEVINTSLHFPQKVKREYTLVLDLDETLVHFKQDEGKAKFLVRPHAYTFLKNASKHFELFIFTAAQKDYADWIIDRIDPKGLISYRLYRNHCQMNEKSHLKVSLTESRNHWQRS